MITADQLLAHGIGDYILQSDWMAQNKTKDSVPAVIHAFVYTLCFYPFLGHSHFFAASVIFGTHFLIDRYRLARYVVWAKNFMTPNWGANLAWRNCAKTGYLDADRLGPPAWLSVWLLIIADNILHVAINGIALKYL